MIGEEEEEGAGRRRGWGGGLPRAGWGKKGGRERETREEETD